MVILLLVKSRGYAYAMVDVSIAHRENIDEVYAAMREVAAKLRASEGYAEKILEDIEIAGVQGRGDSAVVIRCRFKTVALEQ